MRMRVGAALVGSSMGLAAGYRFAGSCNSFAISMASVSTSVMLDCPLVFSSVPNSFRAWRRLSDGEAALMAAVPRFPGTVGELRAGVLPDGCIGGRAGDSFMIGE